MFVGRDDLISSLSEKLSSSERYRYNHRVALYGLGGVGKTQTVLKYVYKTRSLYDSTFWISGVNQASLVSGFRQIATLTKCKCTKDVTDPDLEVVQKVIGWLETQRSWLLVIDNLDDVRIIGGCLPKNNTKKHTLITTRNPNADDIPAQGLEVLGMDPKEASKLLLIRAGLSSDCETSRLHAENIVKELGFLPLAIDQAACFIRETKRKIEDFLPLYRQNRSNRAKLQKWVPEGNRTYQYSVATTWQVSFNHIKSNSRYPLAARLLQLFAFLNPDSILVEFLQAGAESLDHDLRDLINNEIDLDATLNFLERFSLIKRIRDLQAISIHRLVQDVIMHEFEDQHLLEKWKTVISFLLAFPEYDVTDNYSKVLCRRYQDQVLVPLSRCGELASESVLWLLDRVWNFLRNEGSLTTAEQLMLKCVRINASLNGKRHRSTLRSMNNLANTYSSLGRHNDALDLNQTVLNARKDVLGERHPDTLSSMSNLALTYSSLGRHNDALVLNQTVLNAQKDVLGERHPDTLRSMSNLALTYSHLGQHNDALDLNQTVLNVRKHVLGERHPDTLTSMNNLAATYSSLGRDNDALDLKQTVLNARKDVLGERHPYTLTSMNNLAATYSDLGRHNDALDLNQTVLNARKDVLGERHPDTLLSMNNLALIYSHLGRHNDALDLNQTVLNAQKDVLGEQHPDTLRSMNNLASTYSDLGWHNDALDLKQTALNARKDLFGERHPDTLTSINNLANTYSDLGRHNEALDLKQTVLNARKDVLGSDTQTP
jgi:tetratricopeptide (TPR) repeat protein